MAESKPTAEEIDTAIREIVDQSDSLEDTIRIIDQVCGMMGGLCAAFDKFSPNKVAGTVAMQSITKGYNDFQEFDAETAPEKMH